MKKFLASFAIFCAIFTSFAAFMVRPAHAQLVGPWYDQPFQQWFGKVYDDSNPQEIFGERYTAAQVQWIVYSLISVVIPNKQAATACFYGAVDPLACATQLLRFVVPFAYEPMGEKSIAYRVNDVADGLSAIVREDRPVSGVGYVRDTLAKVSVSNAYAQDTQGTGFRGLTSVRSIWQASRDVTYVLMVLVIIAMAFMIMFRMQLPSRTVISVQSSLWSVFTALILITFSYAIAGFAIDIMYIVIGLISVVFTQSDILVVGGSENATFAVYRTLTEGPNAMGAIGFLFSYGVSFFNIFSYILNSPDSVVNAGLVSAFGQVFDLFTSVSSLVLGVMLMFIFFQIMWMLVKTFVNILLLTIVGPFQILIGAAYPGTGGFKGWFMNLLTNLAVYPVVGLLFIMASVFLSGAFYVDRANSPSPFLDLVTGANAGIQLTGFGYSVNQNVFVSGDSTSNWSPPMTFGGFTTFLWLFASFVCVSMTPKTVELIQSFMSGKQFAYGSALGQAAGAAGIGFVAGQAKDIMGQGVRGGVGRALGFAMSGTRSSGGTSKTIGQNAANPQNFKA